MKLYKVKHNKNFQGEAIYYSPFPEWSIGWYVLCDKLMDSTNTVSIAFHSRTLDPVKKWHYQQVPIQTETINIFKGFYSNVLTKKEALIQLNRLKKEANQ